MKKKNQAIQFQDIHIAKPCHADWEQMTASEKGRFCASCEKEVYDFTDGDIEKLKRTQQENPGQVCGRFSLRDVPHLSAHSQRKKKQSLPVPIFAKSTIYRIAFSFLTITGAHHAIARDVQVTILNEDNFPLPEYIKISKPQHYYDIMGNFVTPFPLPESSPDNSSLHFSILEKPESSQPKEEEAESDTEKPQRAPIVPILNRMPALHKKRLKGNEKDKEKKLPWK